MTEGTSIPSPAAKFRDHGSKENGNSYDSSYKLKQKVRENIVFLVVCASSEKHVPRRFLAVPSELLAFHACCKVVR